MMASDIAKIVSSTVVAAGSLGPPLLLGLIGFILALVDRPEYMHRLVGRDPAVARFADVRSTRIDDILLAVDDGRRVPLPVDVDITEEPEADARGRRAVDREFANVFVCRFDDEGRCREFTEWYMRRRPEAIPE